MKLLLLFELKSANGQKIQNILACGYVQQRQERNKCQGENQIQSASSQSLPSKRFEFFIGEIWLSSRC